MLQRHAIWPAGMWPCHLYPAAPQPALHLPPPAGEYEAASPRRSGPAFSMGGRPSSSGGSRAGAAQLPGPGEYQSGAGSLGGPAYSMGPAPDRRRSSCVPESATMPGGGRPAWMACLAGLLLECWAPRTPRPLPWHSGGGCAHRGGAAAAPSFAAAGPGNYNTGGSTLAGPAFSMAGRPQSDAGAQAAGPGPGTYDSSPSRQDGPAFSIGGRWRDSAGGAAEAPGPGEYSSQGGGGRSGPAFTMGSRHRSPDDMQAGDTPGGRCRVPAGRPACLAPQRHPPCAATRRNSRPASLLLAATSGACRPRAVRRQQPGGPQRAGLLHRCSPQHWHQPQQGGVAGAGPLRQPQGQGRPGRCPGLFHRLKGSSCCSAGSWASRPGVPRPRRLPRRQQHQASGACLQPRGTSQGAAPCCGRPGPGRI
jgi:hypothetical protein